MAQDSISYEQVCKYVGQLWLESRNDVEALTARLQKAERERDQAVAALVKPPRPEDA